MIYTYKYTYEMQTTPASLFSCEVEKAGHFAFSRNHTNSEEEIE